MDWLEKMNSAVDYIEAYFVYVPFQANQENELVLYGLDISDTEVYKDNFRAYKEAVVLIPNVTKQPEVEVGVSFIKYLFGL